MCWRICARQHSIECELLIPDDDLQLLGSNLDVEPLIDEIQQKYGCNPSEDEPKTPYTLDDLVRYVAANGRFGE